MFIQDCGEGSISMSADSLLQVKYMLRHTCRTDAHDLLQQALAQSDTAQVR